MDSFSYTIRDRAANRLLAYSSRYLPPEDQRAPAAAVARLVREDRYLRDGGYGTVLLGWETERMTVVPKELYRGERKRSYLEQLTTVSLEDLVEEVWYDDLNAHLLYAAHEPVLHDLRGHLHFDRVSHVSGGLLRVWAGRSRREEGGASVSVALRGSRLLIAVHESGNLRFVNTFRFATKEDVLYYVLLAFEHNDLLPSEVPLYVCGEILEDSALYGWLYRYVQDIEFCRLSAPPAAAPGLTAIPHHLYFDLLCLA